MSSENNTHEVGVARTLDAPGARVAGVQRCRSGHEMVGAAGRGAPGAADVLDEALVPELTHD